MIHEVQYKAKCGRVCNSFECTAVYFDTTVFNLEYWIYLVWIIKIYISAGVGLLFLHHPISKLQVFDYNISLRNEI